MFARFAQRSITTTSRRAFGSHAHAAPTPVLGMERPAGLKAATDAATTRVSLPGDGRFHSITWSFNRFEPQSTSMNAWSLPNGNNTHIALEFNQTYIPATANIVLGIIFGVFAIRETYVGGELATRCGFARSGSERQELIKQWYANKKQVGGSIVA